MAGMLTKELIHARSGKRMLYLIGVEIVFLLFLTFSRLMTAPAELASYVGMLMGLMAATETFNGVGIDEKTKWDAYARSLPASVFQIVGAKYLSMLIFSAAGAALGTLFLIFPAGGHPDGSIVLLQCAIACTLPILATSVALPLFYRFSYQKTNLILILLICVWPLVLSGRRGLTGAQLIFVLKLAPAVLAAVLFLSFVLSCSIYSRKEL